MIFGIVIWSGIPTILLQMTIESQKYNKVDYTYYESLIEQVVSLWVILAQVDHEKILWVKLPHHVHPFQP